METKVLLFSVDTYNRRELDEMSDSEKYELACIAFSVGYDEASVLSLDEFSRLLNDEDINMNNVWVYFVTI